jgi:glycerophosphoryl diester phosphodiesterase
MQSLHSESFDEIVSRTGGYPVNAVHRGGGGVFGPENTLHSFNKAVEAGARLLEIDLRLTRDYQLCLMHDYSVERTTDGNGPVHTYSLEEIMQLDAAVNYPELKGRGIGVPSFAQFLERFAPVPDLLFLFDFKDTKAYRLAMKQIAPYKIEGRYMLGCVFSETNGYMHYHSAWKGVPIVGTVGQTFKLVSLYDVRLLGPFIRGGDDYDVVGFILRRETKRFWSRGLVDAIHSTGRAIMVCGEDLSAPERMRECIAWGVEYIMSDRPDLLQEILRINDTL